MATASIILIGGAPCAGKSTVAEALAKELRCSVFETDVFRDKFRENNKHRAKEFHWLFQAVGINAEQYWDNRSSQDAINCEIGEAAELWPTMKKEIASHRYGIAEGISLFPSLIHKYFGCKYPSVFLIDEDRQRVKDTIYSRGLWGWDADSYADSVKSKEIDWVMAFNDWFVKEVKRYGYSLIRVGERETLVARVKAALKIG